MKCAVSISVNGRRYQQDVEPRLLLVHFLREAGLTGTKIGCDTSQCGACTVLIEHHMDVIKTADHVIDLGPEGGHAGGRVVVTGTPEDVVRCKASHTGRFLKVHLRR